MSVEVVSGVRIVQCHAIMVVVIGVRVMEYHTIIDVVINVHVMLCHQAIDNSGFSIFLNFPLRVQILILSSSCINSSSLFHVTFCAHFCTAKTRHLRCGIHSQRIVEIKTISQWSGFCRIIERDPPIPSLSKALCLRHMIRVIFLRKIVHLDTRLFSSIMFELRFTEFRIFSKTIENPFTRLLMHLSLILWAI